MAKKIKTIFQNLDKALNDGWVNDVTQMKDVLNANPDEVVYKADTPEEYQTKKLELQQNSYLKDRWIRANTDLSVKAFNGLNNIKLMYRDVELMDSFPEIGAALDLVAEEACTVSQQGGHVVNVYSKSDRIKNILEDLFVNRLNLNVMAVSLIRGMCKYGNQYMLLNLDNNLGVCGWREIPPFGVERLENGITNPYGGYSYVNQLAKNMDLSTKFTWMDESSSSIQAFRNWQIAHFRLLTDTLYMPYGCLVGDTRVETEDGYEEIKNLKIGDKVWTFNTKNQERELATVTMQMNKGVKDVYRISTKHNYVEGTLDHKILSVENNKFVYKEIGELKINDLIVVDVSTNKHNSLIKIDKSPLKDHEKGKNSCKTWWDDKLKYIPNYIDEDFAKFYGFMIGDGSILDNRHISISYGEYENINKLFADYLEKITLNKVRYFKNGQEKNYEYNSFRVSSRALVIILLRLGFTNGFNKKRLPKWIYSCDDNIKKALLNGLMLADGYYSIRNGKYLRCQIEMSNEQLIKDIKILVQSLGYKSGKITKRDRRGETSGFKFSTPSYYFTFYETFNQQEKINDISNRLTNSFKLEKITSIESIGSEETFDITVDNENSNFFANGIVTHNCSFLNKARRHFRMLSLMEDMMLIYRLDRSVERRIFKIYVGAIDDADVEAYMESIVNQFKRKQIIDPVTGQIDLRKNILNATEDYFLPIRNSESQSNIETLPAAQNLTAIDDIKYMQNKVLSALRIPRSFLNFDETQGDGKNLALMDIRFTRVVNRIQQAFLLELTKVATIHLYLLGFEDELTNFTLSMNNPSTQSEQLEVENMQKKILAVRDAVSDPGTGIPIMSLTRALRSIMKWSDKDIQDNFEELRLEKGLAAELEKTSQIIKKTGIFDTVDRIYGEPGAEYQDDNAMQGGDDNGLGGGGGGGSLGGGLGSSGLDDVMDNGEGGDEDVLNGNPETTPLGDENAEQSNASPTDNQNENPNESVRSNGKLLVESVDSLKNFEKVGNEYDKIIDKLIKHEPKGNIFERCEIYDKSMFINKEMDEIVNNLEEFAKSKE